MLEFWDLITGIFNAIGSFGDIAIDFVSGLFNIVTNTLTTLSSLTSYIAPPFNIMFGTMITLYVGFAAYKLLRG